MQNDAPGVGLLLELCSIEADAVSPVMTNLSDFKLDDILLSLLYA